jgi:hypothetical protein
MAIHARSHNEDENPELSCTLLAHLVLPSHSSMTFYSADFYNYFQHGIDFLLSDHTHIVKKIILHSNVVSPFILRQLPLVYPSIAGHTTLPTVQAMSMANRRSA